MDPSLIKAQGSFPLYFSKPEAAWPILSAMGFPFGFCSEHPCGLTLYIHRAKGKKQIAPVGLTIPLFVNDIQAFHHQMENLSVTFSDSYQWLGNPALLMEFDKGKKFLILKEEHFLPPQINNTEPISPAALYGKGFFILNAKHPIRSAEWYAELLGCHKILYSDTLTINIMINAGETHPNLILFHQKTKEKSQIGPVDYQHFCLRAPNIYNAWQYLKAKNKINPRWYGPQEDGIYRTITLSCPDGYRCKIYSEIPYYDKKEASTLLNISLKKIEEEITAGTLKPLEPKTCKKLNLSENSYFCEDHLLAFRYHKSPYTETLSFS